MLFVRDRLRARKMEAGVVCIRWYWLGGLAASDGERVGSGEDKMGVLGEGVQS